MRVVQNKNFSKFQKMRKALRIYFNINFVHLHHRTSMQFKLISTYERARCSATHMENTSAKEKTRIKHHNAIRT